MAGFCTKCGRPLPENGICPCTQQAQVPPQAQPVPQYQSQQPQYQPKQPQYQPKQPQYQPQQPQYQPQQPQYQPQYQQAPVQTPPKAEPQPPKEPKEPSAFGLAIADLPKKFIRFVKDPVAELKSSVEKKDMMGGIVGMAVAVIACFMTMLFYALRWGYGFAAVAWIVDGLFLPVVAGGFTLLGFFVLSKLGKVQADFKGMLAAVGTGALVPAALTLTSGLLQFLGTWFFSLFAILIVTVWVITAFLTVFHVYGVQTKALNLLVFVGFCLVAYYNVDWMRDWFVSSVWSYSSLSDVFSYFN